MKFAAIDIGSNAVRLQFSRVIENGEAVVLRKDARIRIPLRLGTNTFQNKTISDEHTEELIKTIMGFKYLIEAQQPANFMVCATSAFREAANRQEVVYKIKAQTGIQIEVISGRREAELLYSNQITETLDPSVGYIYVDVGGGSTEVTVFAKNRWMTSASFAIGTVRMLENRVADSEWQRLKYWLRVRTREYNASAAIGTGGNIERLFRISARREGTTLSLKKLKRIYTKLKSYQFNERICKFGLRPDRADVIIPACEIYISILKWAGISKIHVPLVGLTDGMIHLLYKQHMRNGKSEHAENVNANNQN